MNADIGTVIALAESMAKKYSSVGIADVLLDNDRNLVFILTNETTFRLSLPNTSDTTQIDVDSTVKSKFLDFKGQKLSDFLTYLSTYKEFVEGDLYLGKKNVDKSINLKNENGVLEISVFDYSTGTYKIIAQISSETATQAWVQEKMDQLARDFSAEDPDRATKSYVETKFNGLNTTVTNNSASVVALNTKANSNVNRLNAVEGDLVTEAEIDTKISSATSTLATKNEVYLKADKTAIPDITGLATQSELSGITGELDKKANADTVYTKTEVDSKISSIPSGGGGSVDLTDYAKKTDIPDISGKADKTELPDISGKADKSTTYTKIEVDTKLSTKANQEALSTINTQLNSGLETLDTNLTNKINAKADKNTVYTKTEVDSKISSIPSGGGGSGSYNPFTAGGVTLECASDIKELERVFITDDGKFRGEWSPRGILNFNTFNNHPDNCPCALKGIKEISLESKTLLYGIPFRKVNDVNYTATFGIHIIKCDRNTDIPNTFTHLATWEMQDVTSDIGSNDDCYIIDVKSLSTWDNHVFLAIAFCGEFRTLETHGIRVNLSPTIPSYEPISNLIDGKIVDDNILSNTHNLLTDITTTTRVFLDVKQASNWNSNYAKHSLFITKIDCKNYGTVEEDRENFTFQYEIDLKNNKLNFIKKQKFTLPSSHHESIVARQIHPKRDDGLCFVLQGNVPFNNGNTDNTLEVNFILVPTAIFENRIIMSQEFRGQLYSSELHAKVIDVHNLRSKRDNKSFGMLFVMPEKGNNIRRFFLETEAVANGSREPSVKYTSISGFNSTHISPSHRELIFRNLYYYPSGSYVLLYLDFNRDKHVYLKKLWLGYPDSFTFSIDTIYDFGINSSNEFFGGIDILCVSSTHKQYTRYEEDSTKQTTKIYTYNLGLHDSLAQRIQFVSGKEYKIGDKATLLPIARSTIPITDNSLNKKYIVKTPQNKLFYHDMPYKTDKVKDKLVAIRNDEKGYFQFF